MFDNVTCPHCGEVSHIGGLIGPHTNDCPKCGKTVLKGHSMKTYQVELKRVSYVTLTVEAKNQGAAEDAAWLELQTGDYDCNDAEWELNDVEELPC